MRYCSGNPPDGGAGNIEGNRIECEAEGFHARIVQHECDHLDGILYPMRMDDMSKFGFEDALNGYV